jgi:hypothetical protein
MSRIISFSDGFTSASAPSLQGADQEDYAILNNQSSPVTIFSIDAALYKSSFMHFELERSDSGGEYRQAGNIILSYDGSVWSFSTGNYQGTSIIDDSLVAALNIVLSITTSTGVGSLKYTSGNMLGTGYIGNLRVYITRIVTA